MRLVMMGTGAFAVPTLRALAASEHTVAAVVTQVERPAQGGRPPPAAPMRAAAGELGIQVLAFENVNTDAARAGLKALDPELLIVADYGQILSAETLAVARLGGVNLHGSLLPKYRGAAPINWAIYHGERQTGVTVIHMTPRIDAGPCLAQAAAPIGPDESAVEVESRLAELGAPVVLRCIESLAAGRVEALPQDASQATPARRLRKSDGQVDWGRPAEAIRNQIRALEPWPKTYTFWQRSGGGTMRLILGRSSVIHRDTPGGVPGTVVDTGKTLQVATGRGVLAIEAIQPAGKRMLSAEEFLRGYAMRAGERLVQE